jgi:hypothetical protein
VENILSKGYSALECQAAPQPSMLCSDSLFRLTVPVHSLPFSPNPHHPTPPLMLLFQSNGSSSLICSGVSSWLAIVYRLLWCRCCGAYACTHLLVIVCRLLLVPTNVVVVAVVEAVGKQDAKKVQCGCLATFR